jgi:hypothetical protein
MATGKYKKKNRGTDDINSRGSVHNVMVRMGNDTDKNERDVPWSLLVALVVVCLMLVLVLPVMAIMYGDMVSATEAAIVETRKMKELRLKLLTEGQ